MKLSERGFHNLDDVAGVDVLVAVHIGGVGDAAVRREKAPSIERSFFGI